MREPRNYVHYSGGHDPREGGRNRCEYSEADGRACGQCAHSVGGNNTCTHPAMPAKRGRGFWAWCELFERLA
jgi:hypothetical protein